MRIVVIGDDGVGKSTLITCLFKDRYVPHIEDQLPTLFFPRNDDSVVALVDTSPSLEKRPQLLAELRRADCVWLVFSDHYTMQRISLFWLPFLRNNGVNLPIILCQNKQDELFREHGHAHAEHTASPGAGTAVSGDTASEEAAEAAEAAGDGSGELALAEVEEDVIQIMQDFKEIESFIRCSAKEKCNVNESFYLCQRAVSYPLAPLFDSKVGQLKPLAQRALSRIFFLCDQDQSGFLTDVEMQHLQKIVFNAALEPEELTLIHQTLFKMQEQAAAASPDGTSPVLIDEARGISRDGFLALAEVYCEHGRHETIWGILRQFKYTDSLSLDDRFLRPQLYVDPQSHVELSPNGYQFLVDLFTLFDQDNDGGLRAEEMENLFTPTAGIPTLWLAFDFPLSTLRNENGFVTLQGWLAQWSMFVYLDHPSALEYLAMLGYASDGRQQVKSAVRVTKPAKRRNPRSTLYRNSVVTDRQVFNCFVLGRAGAGKSTLLSSFLATGGGNRLRPTSTAHTDPPRTVVNSVEMPGGKQCYLILQEFGELEETVFKDAAKIEECDVVCLTYDSSDPDSFAYVAGLRNRLSKLERMPIIFAALKADLDRAQQRCEIQPDAYTAQLGVAAPMHVSSAWPSSLNALFIQLVEAAMHPGAATPVVSVEEGDTSTVLVTAAASVAMAASVLGWLMWRNKQ